MGNSRSRKPNFIFVFDKNVLKPRFLGVKKDSTSRDSNPGPQHWNSENRPVGFLWLFSHCSLSNLIERAISFRMIPLKIFSDNGDRACQFFGRRRSYGYTNRRRSWELRRRWPGYEIGIGIWRNSDRNSDSGGIFRNQFFSRNSDLEFRLRTPL